MAASAEAFPSLLQLVKPKPNRMPSTLAALATGALAALGLLLASGASAKTVGADGSFPAGSTTWALQSYSPLTVTQGDSVLFAWNGDHSVVQMAGNSCNFSGSTTLASESPSGTFTLDTTSVAPGSTIDIACSVPGHCDAGMLLQITVQGTATPGSPQSATVTSSPTSKPFTSGAGSVGTAQATKAALALVAGWVCVM